MWQATRRWGRCCQPKATTRALCDAVGGAKASCSVMIICDEACPMDGRLALTVA